MMKIILILFCKIKIEQMRKYSTKSASNIYLRDQTKLLSEKYSPEYRKRKISSIRVTIQNPDLDKLLSRAKKHDHPYLEKTRVKTGNKVNPQALISSQNSKQTISQKMKQTISKKLLPKSYQIDQYSLSQMRKKEIQMIRDLKTKQYKSQAKRKLQQIQFQYQQRSRQKEIKLRRKTSETSFILETHKQSIELVKKTRRKKVRSELKSYKQLYQQTQRNHEFQILKSKLRKMHQSQILAYHKTFLKNQQKNDTNLATPSKISFSSNINSLMEQKFKVLPKIKEYSKIKKKDRIIKKTPKSKLNQQKEIIISHSNDIKTNKVADCPIIKCQEKVNLVENDNNKEKEDNFFVLQNQITQKKI